MTEKTEHLDPGVGHMLWATTYAAHHTARDAATKARMLETSKRYMLHAKPGALRDAAQRRGHVPKMRN